MHVMTTTKKSHWILQLTCISTVLINCVEGLVDEVCLNKTSSDLSFAFNLPSLQVIQNISFNQTIFYHVTNVSYTYDNTTWYTIELGRDFEKNIPLNLYALGLVVNLKPTNNSTNGCVNATLQLSNEIVSPTLNFNTTENILVSEKELILHVTGQEASVPKCRIFNSELTVSELSRRTNYTQLTTLYSVLISKTDHFNTLCSSCSNNPCTFELTCYTRYPGSSTNVTAGLSIQTNVSASTLEVTSIVTNNSYVQLSGNISSIQCQPNSANVNFKSATKYVALSGNSFIFDVYVGQCSSGDLSIATYTALNVSSSSVQYIDIQTQPVFNFNAVLTSDNVVVNVSWVGTTCLTNYEYVQVSYNADMKEAIIKNVTSSSLMVLIPVDPNTKYHIRIRLVATSTVSNHSGVITITTPMGVPKITTNSLERFLNITWVYSSTDSANVTFNLTITSHRPYDALYISNTRTYITNQTNIVDTSFNIESATEYKIQINSFNGVYYSNTFMSSILSPLAVNSSSTVPKPTQVSLTATTVTMKLNKIAPTYGPVSFYEVIVMRGKGVLPSTIISYNYTDSNIRNLTYYVCLRIPQLTSDSVNVLVGSKESNLNYYNAPLQPNTEYTIFVRYGSKWNNKLHFSPINKNAGLKVKTEHVPIPKNNDDSLSSGVKAAIIVTAILLVFILFFCWIAYQVRKHRNQETSETSKVYNSTLPRKQSNISQPGHVNLAYELDSVGHVLGYFPLKYEVDEKIKPVSVSEFPTYIADIKTSFDIQRQFQKLRDGKEFECRHGKDPINVSRNRYEDITPYDQNRFILEVDRKISDYINASIVANYIKRDAYIATQGPLPSTFNDFWKMVWQSDATTIVVLGQRIENGIIKYALYWPTAPNVEMKYGKIMAKMKSFDKHPRYTVTSMFLYKRSQPKMRTVNVFHFSAWPDREAPLKIQDLLTFRNAVQSWQGDSKGPIIIHCSAGVGRTGAFIAIDAIIENLKRTQSIDIFNYVNYLRTRRMHMVQTQEQYQFIHDALLEHIMGQSSDVDITKQNVERILKELAQFDVKTNMDGFTKYFLKLNRLSSKPRLPEDCEGFKEIHTHKNRYTRVVPIDNYRFKLLVPGVNVNDTYINATRINNRLITTQAPLEATCKDFWLMVYDTDTKNIVMLNNRQEGADIFPDYFSVAETTTHGPLSVTVVSEISVLDVVVKREMILKHEDAKTDEQFIAHYHLKNWPVEGPPDSINPVIYIVNELLRSNASEPSIIHCNDGFNRSGCLIACLLCVEKLDELDHVTVDDVIVMLRERHNLFVDNVEKYEFVYQFLKDFLTARYSGVTYI